MAKPSPALGPMRPKISRARGTCRGKKEEFTRSPAGPCGGSTATSREAHLRTRALCCARASSAWRRLFTSALKIRKPARLAVWFNALSGATELIKWQDQVRASDLTPLFDNGPFPLRGLFLPDLCPPPPRHTLLSSFFAEWSRLSFLLATSSKGLSQTVT